MDGAILGAALGSRREAGLPGVKPSQLGFMLHGGNGVFTGNISIPMESDEARRAHQLDTYRLQRTQNQTSRKLMPYLKVQIILPFLASPELRYQD